MLRFDPPGTGLSGGVLGPASLEQRREDTIAAARSLRSRPEIDPDGIGLLGWSQGPWVMAMAAAEYPDEVAFLVSVVGSGQTVAEQQLYGIEAQSRAAGLAEEDVATAVLFGRLLVDWQLVEPIHREVNEAAVAERAREPWTTFAGLVYSPEDHVETRLEAIRAVTAIMREVEDEPWASELHLRDLFIDQFEAIPDGTPDDRLAALQLQVDANLRTDPADFLTEVRTPVLAIFGELDVNIDSATSAPLYERYLAEAGNDDLTVVVLPDVGHDIGVATPGYWSLVTEWLRSRFPL